jgi:hypothetical protein
VSATVPASPSTPGHRPRATRALVLILTATLVAGVCSVALATARPEPAAAAPNGCGAQDSWASAFIPNSVAGLFNFTASCDGHDNCYARSGIPRHACDDWFQEDMNASCASSWWPGACRGVASLYAWAVRTFGEKAYEPAPSQYWPVRCYTIAPGCDPFGPRDPWRDDFFLSL